MAVKKKKSVSGLLSTLAITAPEDSRALLKANGINNYSNIEGGLASLWARSDDKRAVEKAFASIHPHREFILKYNPPPEPKVIIKEADRETLNENLSSCSGDKTCNCENKSGVDGSSQAVLQSPQPIHISSDTLAILAVVSVVAMVALVIHKS